MNARLRLALVTVVALAMPIVPFVAIGELPGERWLEATDTDALLFALTGGGLLVLDVVLPVPSSIMITLLGSRLGFLEGWLAAFLGLTAGHAVGYAIGRLWPARLAPGVAEHPSLLVLILTRPVPILAEALVLAAGAARLPFLHVLAACASGNAVYAAVLAANGAAFLADGAAGVAVFVVLLVPAVGWLVWRRSARTPAPDATAADAASAPSHASAAQD